MTLQTNLQHIVTAADLQKTIEENENVMVCCGRMGPMCVPVYDIMEDLEKSGKYDHVVFQAPLITELGAGSMETISYEIPADKLYEGYNSHKYSY